MRTTKSFAAFVVRVNEIEEIVVHLPTSMPPLVEIEVFASAETM